MMIAKKALGRRTFLRGMGVTVALPFLDAMVPAVTALTKTAARPSSSRLGFIYVPNGTLQHEWVPATVGAGFELSPILSPLAPVKEHVLVVSGLAHKQADSFGDGVGDHPRGTAAWLSGVHAWDRQPGVEVRLGVTADQIAARAFSKETQIPSLEIVLEKPTRISCDTGDCFFSNTLSWRNATTPNPMEPHPRRVFDRLFGDGGSSSRRRAQIAKTDSILDSVVREVNRLENSLGPGDRTKLDEYLDSVREIEQRIQRIEVEGTQSLDLPGRPVDIPGEFEEHAKLMFDLLALAYQADVTRVFTMMMGREGSTRTYPKIGVPDQHHPMSHHRQLPTFMAKKLKIDTYHVTLLEYFLDKLRKMPDGDGSVLDHSMIMYGGGLGDGNLHTHTNLPLVLAGGLSGKLRTGRHLAFPDETPVTNMLLALLDKSGSGTDKLGDSTGRLNLD